MKRFTSLLLASILAILAIASLASCGGNKGIEIAVPNDSTNEASAHVLLEANGLIKLKEGAGITATVRDIVENPYNIKFREIEAASLPNVLKDVDFAVINSNYAISASLNPTKDSVAIEGSYSAYANILAVKEGNENTPAIKALKAALESNQVKEFIAKQYNGAVISTVDTPTDGYDASIDYAALAGTKITVAASSTPHAEILEIAKSLLAAKQITLEIKVFSDYIVPNNVVENGECDANYFQHTPYLDDFNKENGTHIVSVSAIHVEPMGVYSTSHKSLDEIKK